jgi:hypothetical protein
MAVAFVEPVLAQTTADVADEEITLPRSRRRQVAAPRRMLAGDSPESLGDHALTPDERDQLARDLVLLGHVTLGPPRDDRDCPTGPCPRVGCRHHLYLEVNRDILTLMFPGRHVDEIPETCSLRVARAAAGQRPDSKRGAEPAMSCAEIGRFLNLTAETVRNELKTALAKLRAAGFSANIDGRR